MVPLGQRQEGVIESVRDHRRCEGRGAGRDGVLVDLSPEPAVQVGGLAGQLVAVAGADEVRFGLGLVLPADHDAPVLQGLHPGVDIEGLRGGEVLRCSRVDGGRDPIPHAGQQLVAADPGERMFLRVEQHVDQNPVLRRVLVRREVSRDVEPPREPREFPGVDVRHRHDSPPPFRVPTLDAPSDNPEDLARMSSRSKCQHHRAWWRT